MSVDFKVFCLGMSRTGTKSFAQGMSNLGFRTLHNGGRPLSNDNLKNHDAFSDSATCMFYYKSLYKIYPDAYYVFSYRDAESWADKIVNWYNTKYKINYIEWHLNGKYVEKVNTKQELIDFNNWQHKSITEFFRDKPHQFIKHSVFEGDTFKPIIDLIGLKDQQDFSIHLKDEKVSL